MKFKDVIRNLRNERGFTQQELATALDVTDGTISAWETGIRTPTFAKLQFVADYFHVSTDYLLGNVSEEDEPRITHRDAAKIIRFMQDNPEYKQLMFYIMENVSKDDLSRIFKIIELSLN